MVQVPWASSAGYVLQTGSTGVQSPPETKLSLVASQNEAQMTAKSFRQRSFEQHLEPFFDELGEVVIPRLFCQREDLEHSLG